MPRFSANISILFNDLPFMDRFAAARAAGFHAVECWFPGEHGTTEIAQQLDAHGLEMVGINTSRGVGDQWGLAAVPGQEAAFGVSMDDALAQAALLGCSNIHVMAGMTHGDPAAAHRTFLLNLEHAIRRAEGTGITLLIEPLNHFDRPGYLLSSTVQAAEIIAQAGLHDLRLMFDCYHVAREEGGVLERMRAVWPHIGHIQIAGVPNRGAPDQGELDYAPIFQGIDELGWPGWVGAEYQASGPAADSLDWLKRSETAQVQPS